MKRLSRFFIVAYVSVVLFTYSASFCQKVFSVTGDPTSEVVTTSTNHEDALWNIDSYDEYITLYQHASKPKITISVDAVEGKVTEGEAYIKTEYLSKIGKYLYTAEGSKVLYHMEVPETGLYTFSIEGATVPGKQTKVERAIYVDGSLPFQEAATMEISRVWSNADFDVRTDKIGNQLSPAQEEKFTWAVTPLTDSKGFYNEPLLLYLTKGIHEFTVVSAREPYLVSSLRLGYIQTTPSYKEYYSGIKSKPEATAIQLIQAEDATLKSDQILVSNYDHNSTAMQPYSSKQIVLNQIGGTQWSADGQWIEWELTPEQTGLYTLSLKYKQDSTSLSYVSRSLYINGEIPFDEANHIVFPYGKKWQVMTLGDQTPYQFFFEKGKKYNIRLEVTLGDMANLIRQAEESVNCLNDVYREIVMITGTVPDKYRDYHFEKQIPETLETMNEQLEILQSLRNEILSSEHAGSNHVSSITQVVVDLERMVTKPSNIASFLDAFKTDIGSFASWVLEIQKQSLALDWFAIASQDKDLPCAEKGVWSQLLHVVNTFLYSFTNDYNAIQSNDSDDRIVVWVGSSGIGGRDQMQVLQQMVNDSFTPTYKIDVDVQLVSNGTLLPSALAGVGPDVAIQVENTLPMNYGMRNAVKDLSGFKNFDDVIQRFDQAAVVPYCFRNKVFALPDTYSFPMMFVRLDVMDSLGLKIPKNWNEFKDVVSELKKKNMEAGLPHDFNTFSMMLFQNDISVYEDDGIRVNFDEPRAVKVFEEYTKLFTEYQMQLTYDAVNRFRTGEMPILIADYTLFNHINVFAPEIKGQWTFCAVPETINGNVSNKTVTGTGTATVMMSGCRNAEIAWTFMCWWSDTEAQLSFSRRIEAILGKSARYSTANLKAFEQLPWSNDELRAITEQRSFAKGVPEVPGGYMTSRYYNFAFLAVVNSSKNPVEQIRKYAKLIDKELEGKRLEFGIMS